MKTKIKLFSGIISLTALIIFSCIRTNTKNLDLVGVWVMTVTELNQHETINNSDTTFNSLYSGLKYIPNSSEWNFINDSALVVSKTIDSADKPDTVIYKINHSGDSLIIISQMEELKYPLKIVNPNQIELDMGDKTVTYNLTKKQ